MIKKLNSKYESPFLKVLWLDVNDIVKTSGDNYFEWDWDDEKPYDGGIFN